jgi:hypothetical protein
MNAPKPVFNAHVYAVMRVAVADVGAMGQTPEDIANAVADAVCQKPDAWTDGSRGVVATETGQQFSITEVAPADGISWVLVDEVIGDRTIEHHFDHTCAPMVHGSDYQTAKEATLALQVEQLKQEKEQLLQGLNDLAFYDFGDAATPENGTRERELFEQVANLLAKETGVVPVWAKGVVSEPAKAPESVGMGL